MQRPATPRSSCLSRRQVLRRSCEKFIAGAALGVSPFATYRHSHAQQGSATPPDKISDSQSASSPESLSVVDFRNEAGKQTSVDGRILVRATDGGLLVEDRAGRLWTIPMRHLDGVNSTDRPFQLLTADQLGNTLVSEARSAGIDAEFSVHETDHYVIAASTPHVYSEWTGQLLERMQIAFRSYWKNRHFELHSAPASLPVLILSDQTQFAKMAEFDRTPASAQGQGYFLVTANRVVLFDLTAQDGLVPATNIAEIQRRVQQTPASVATVVHEAVHQIAFNQGMHRRYADNPLWLTEGMAMYFEAPDLQSRRGWSTIGRVNPGRLSRFRDFLKSDRKATSIETLVQDNSRFADPEQAIDAYAEAWALTYFLIRTQARKYVDYLKTVAQKQPLVWDTPAERLAEFQAAFGSDVAELDRDFLNFTDRLK